MASPGLLKSLFVGRGANSIPQAQRVISPTGAKTFSFTRDHNDTLSSAARKYLQYKLFGGKPLSVLHQRMRQGGVFGEGGLVRGPYAFSPEFENIVNTRGLKDAVLERPWDATKNLAMRGVSLGIPAAGIINSFKENDPRQLLDTAADAATWTLASPFGLVGGPLAYKGITNFTDLGKQFLQSRAAQNKGYEFQYPKDDLYKF